MPNVVAVERALIAAGESRATPRLGGFSVRALSTDAVVVRWRPPARNPDDGSAILYVEEYAQILRQAGISATLVLDPRGPRVLCTPEDPAVDQHKALNDADTEASHPRAAGTPGRIRGVVATAPVA